ncbi:MAG TPA: TolC family protein [Ignavibacteria bacterium]
MKKFFIIIFLLSASISWSQKTYTLKEVIDIGFGNSKDLKISNSKLVSSNAKIDEVNSQFLPLVTFNAGYTRYSDVTPFEIKLPNFPVPIKLYDVILNNYNMRLSVQQPLFTGFRLRSLKNSAQYSNTSSELDLVKDKNDVAINTHIAFWNLYKAKLIKIYIDDIVKINEQHLTDTRNLMNHGLATQGDILKLEVAFSNAKLQQIDAQNNIEIARIVLNKTIGLPISDNTDIQIDPIDTSSYYNNVKELSVEGKNNRAELKSLQYKISAAQENILATRSAYYPNVFLTGGYTFAQPNQRYQPPLNQFKGTWDVGINLNWTLLNWGNTSAQIVQAEQNLVQVQTNLEQLKENIEVEINQNYLNLKFAKEKLGVAQLAISQAQENLRMTEDKYKSQIATSTDIIDAQNALLQSSTNYTNALVDYQLSKIKLEKSLGRRIY